MVVLSLGRVSREVGKRAKMHMGRTQGLQMLILTASHGVRRTVLENA